MQSEAVMRIRIQVVIKGENGDDETVEEVGCLERGALRPEELGLTLCEAKQLLHAVQQTVSPSRWNSTWRNARSVLTVADLDPEKANTRSCTALCSANSSWSVRASMIARAKIQGGIARVR